MKNVWLILVLAMAITSPVNAEEVIVSWNDYYDPNALGLRVYSSEDQNVWLEEIHHIHQSETEVIIDPPNTCGMLYVIVASFNAEGEEAWSHPATLHWQCGPQDDIDDDYPIEDDIDDELEDTVEAPDEPNVYLPENEEVIMLEEEPKHDDGDGGCFIRSII